MMRRAFHCVALALVLCVIAPLSAMGNVPGGRIYYAGPSHTDANVFRDGVWSTAPDGSNNRLDSRFDSVSNLNNQIFLPVLSRHTRVFVFSTFNSPTQIFTVPEAGSTLRAIQSPPLEPQASSVSDHDFTWSPGDHLLAFVGSTCCGLVRNALWVESSTGGSLRRLLKFPPGTEVSAPEWDPNGRWITFTSSTLRRVRGNVSRELSAISPNGRHLHQLTHLHLDGPSVYLWSPGGRLAIAAASGIFIADRQLRHLTRVAPKGAYNPVFSPDGAELAFVKNLPEVATYRRDAAYFGLHDSAIYLTHSDGGGWRRLTRGHHYDQAPAWSPTGHWISFSRDESLWIAPGHGKPYRVPNQPACCVSNDAGSTPVFNAISTWVP